MKCLRYIVLFLSLFFALVTFVSADIPAVEREALIALYNSTNGAGWNNNANWNGAPGTENTWFGITTDAGNTTVLEIRLGSNNLTGPLPPEIGNLPNVRIIFLDRNHINGSIPGEIGNLTNLNRLNLLGNDLTGSIPTTIVNLSQITHLSLHGNELSGTIPRQLGLLTTLQYLYLNSNQLNGYIPPEFEYLVNLRRLHLDSNLLRGPIPASMGLLTDLEQLRLGYCRFSGPIPPELGNLQNLRFLNISNNYLTGSIPPELGDMTNLQYLFLEGNELLGEIPSSLGNLTNLVDNGSDFRWNGLHTPDSALRNFLNTKQEEGNDWESTQTVPPVGVMVDAVNYNSIELSWDEIVYTADGGGYRAYYATQPGGPYTLGGANSDKTDTTMEISGLQEGTTYYFVVQSYTDTHFYNKNTVDSEYSLEVSAATLNDSISGYVRLSGGQGVAGVTLSFSDGGGSVVTDGNGYYSHAVSHGWSGRVTPSSVGYTFEPGFRDYTNVDGNETGQDYTAVPITPGISGRVTVNGGSGLANVTVTFSGVGSTTTSATGDYYLTVPYNWDGTVTPSLAGYTFNPPVRNYNDVTGDMSEQNFTATPITPIISGRITDGSGAGVPNVNLSFSNGGGSAVTNANGDYSQDVPYNWSGIVNPALPGYTFTPPNRTYSGVTSDKSGQDFTANSINPVISGRITTAGGTAVSGVTLTFSNGGGTATTDGNGNYSRAVAYGWSGTVTPTLLGWVFTPGFYNFNNVVADSSGNNFTAQAVTPIISGRVTNGGGQGISGVLMTFSGVGTTVTDNQGYYAFAVTFGWSGSVTPSKTGYVFQPASRSYTPVGADQPNQDYVGAAIQTVISGQVTDQNGNPLAGVELSFSHISNTILTGSNGLYSQAVSYGWSGTVTPFKEGYTFEPSSRQYTAVISSKDQQDFVATAVMPVISGRVTDNGGTGIPGVTLTLTTGGSTVTGANGTYSIAVDYGWSGSVTPSREGFGFEPGSRDYISVISDQKDQDYIAQALTPVISGRISDSLGSGIFEVAITFSNGGGSTTTDAGGNYVHALPYGWSGIVVPAKTGFTFNPASRQYTGLTADMTNQDYTATAVTPVISGRITDAAGNGIFNVTLTFSNGGGSTTTGNDGYYLNNIPYNWGGTVTPVKEGYTFSPQMISYNSVVYDRRGENYIAQSIYPVISGQVTFEGGIPVPGVQVVAEPGTLEVLTDALGHYQIAVPYGWSGVVTPQFSGYHFEPGTHGFTNVTASISGQDFLCVRDLVITLQVTRETARAWVVRRDYAKISILFDNPGNVPIGSFVIMRKTAGGEFETLEEHNYTAGMTTFEKDDLYLERGVGYTYKIVAYNPDGQVAGMSDEITI